MLKRPLAPLGMQIKISLLNLNETQEWLIKKAREKTGMYVDSSNLYKLMTGQLHSKRLESAVREILNIHDEKQAV
jgi:hypothetical protein